MKPLKKLKKVLAVLVVMVLTGCEPPITQMRICDSTVHESPVGHEYVDEGVTFLVWSLDDFEPKCDYHIQPLPADTFVFTRLFDWHYADSLESGCYALVKLRRGTKYGIRTKCI